MVRGIFEGYSRPEVALEFVEQAEQLGTGHAVRCAREKFTGEREARGHDVLVLAGDGPLIRARTLRTLLARHRETGAAATLATSVIADPVGYGRIIRDASGSFVGIVEEKNATPEQLRGREVNPSYYCFDTSALFAALERVERNPASGEYYVTDVPALLLGAGEREDVLSINTPEQLAEVDVILRGRMAPCGCGAGGCGGAAGVGR